MASNRRCRNLFWVSAGFALLFVAATNVSAAQPANDHSSNLSSPGSVGHPQKGDRATSSGQRSGEAGNPENTEAGTSRYARVSLNADQRSRVRSAFSEHLRGTRSEGNIDARIGGHVPESAPLTDMPQEVIGIVSEWAPYKYIYTGDLIGIVDPATREVVDVVEAS
jgi:hypothetical protein